MMERNVQGVTSGGTRIYQTGDANSSGWGTNLLFGKIFTYTCLKRKEIGRDGGTWIASAPPPLGLTNGYSSCRDNSVKMLASMMQNMASGQ